MRFAIWCITRVYAALLHLYPQTFRDTFAQEMCTVFSDAIAEASQRGAIVFGWTCLRELYDLLMSILRAHWRERTKVENGRGDAQGFEKAPLRAVLAATVPFLVIAILSLINTFQLGGTAVSDWLGYIFLATLILPFLIGLLSGFPRWCLPYVGLFASLVNLIVFLNISSVLYRLISMSDPWIVRLTIQAGLPWVGLFVLTALSVTVILVLPPLRPVYTKIRGDWTLLSFTLYGAMVLELVVTFEDYPPIGRGFYETVCSFVLAAGAWAYLRSTRVRQRALVLFAGVALTMAVAVIGKALLIASPEWPFPHSDNNWQGEAISTVIDGAWMLFIILLLPALVNLLPRPSRPVLSV